MFAFYFTCNYLLSPSRARYTEKCLKRLHTFNHVKHFYKLFRRGRVENKT